MSHQFPIMGRHPTTIPWDMIAIHEKQALANHSQSLERLAQRGGLARHEAVAILLDRPLQAMNEQTANDLLESLVTQWEEWNIDEINTET